MSPLDSINYYSNQDFCLWARPKVINYITGFILFFSLGYIVDKIFLCISIATIIILFFLKKTKVPRYIINQPIFLWLSFFTSYIIISADTFAPFSWLDTLDFDHRYYGILQIIQNQTEKNLFIFFFLLMYIGINIDLWLGYDKWTERHIIKKLKKDYVCIEFPKKPPKKEDILHYLSSQGDIKKIEYLFQNKLLKVKEIYNKDEYGRPPLHLVKNTDMISFLIKKGVEVDDINVYSSQTLLHLSSRRRDLKMVKFLLEKGANINKKDIRGRTPLDYAKNNDLRQFLISKGGKETSLYNKIKYFLKA